IRVVRAAIFIILPSPPTRVDPPMGRASRWAPASLPVLRFVPFALRRSSRILRAVPGSGTRESSGWRWNPRRRRRRPVSRSHDVRPDGEDAGHARLQHEGEALHVPSAVRIAVARKVLAGYDVAVFVACDLVRQPTGVRLRADEYEKPGCGNVFGDARDGALQYEVLEPSPATAVYHPGRRHCGHE